MKARVDPSTCTGCGLCTDTCPQVFEMDGDVAKAKVSVVPLEVETLCREAADACPVEAIEIKI